MNSSIEIWISPLLNPTVVMVAGVEVNVTSDCLGEQRCTIYTARGYFRTINTQTITNYQNASSSFTPSDT